MEEFFITVKNEKRRSYKISLIIIIFLNLIAFLFLAYYANSKRIRNESLLAAEMVAISLVLHFLIKNKERVDFRWAAIALSLFFYFRLGFYWPAITLIVLSLLYLVAVRDLTIYISKDIIKIPAFPKKKSRWIELNNILLKDDILTIDFKNNSLLQQPIDNSKTSVSEKEFNEFCRERLLIARTTVKTE